MRTHRPLPVPLPIPAPVARGGLRSLFRDRLVVRISLATLLALAGPGESAEPAGSPPDRIVDGVSRPSGATGIQRWPEGWEGRPVRRETSPRFAVGVVRLPGGSTGHVLEIEGRGHPGEDGRWSRTVPVEGGLHYRFRALFRAARVADPERSVLARIDWLGPDGRRVGTPDHPATSRKLVAFASDEGSVPGGHEVRGVYRAPEGAASARLELHLRWAPRGAVAWRGVRFEPTEPPPPRRVRLATVHHRARTGSPAANLRAYGELVEKAAATGADFVCLPEGITVVGTGKTYVDVAEPIPGPSTGLLGRIAARHGLHIVAGLYERAGPAVHNTAVLIGPDGRLVGRYRKVCLPREEIDGGITPGDAYPVFDTEHGRVAMMICWDVHFPEVARELARQGAEIIFLPIWGGNETLARARAIENQVHLVASGYDFTSRVIGPRGDDLALASDDPEIVAVEVDLARREMWRWLGDWRSRIWREAPSRP